MPPSIADCLAGIPALFCKMRAQHCHPVTSRRTRSLVRASPTDVDQRDLASARSPRLRMTPDVRRFGMTQTAQQGLPAAHHLLHGERRDPAHHGLSKRAAEQSAASARALVAAPSAAEHATQHPAKTAERIVTPLLPVLRDLSGHQPRVVIVIIDLATALLAHPAT